MTNRLIIVMSGLLILPLVVLGNPMMPESVPVPSPSYQIYEPTTPKPALHYPPLSISMPSRYESRPANGIPVPTRHIQQMKQAKQPEAKEDRQVLEPLPDHEMMTVEIPANVIQAQKRKQPISTVEYGYNQMPANVSLDGFYEMKFSQRSVTPKEATGNLRNTIRSDPSYTKLPRDVLTGPLRREIRFDIDVEGQFSDDLSVLFHVEQEPDFPLITDIKIKYKYAELQFGRYDAVFKNGSFLNLTRSLEGIKLTDYRPNKWDVLITQGQERSKPKRVEFDGNGGRTYTLPNKNILTNSVIVYVNNQEVSDYTVNYSEGSIEFNSPKTADNFIKVLYEFTNPVADFLPAINRKSFLGAQYKWSTDQVAKYTRIKTKTSETLHNPDTTKTTPKNTYNLSHFPVVLGSETVKINDYQLQTPIDYYIDHDKGTLQLVSSTAMATDRITIDYSYYNTKTMTEVIPANDSKGPYFLSHDSVLKKSVTIQRGKDTLSNRYDYQVDYSGGKLYFDQVLKKPDLLTVTYTYYETELISEPATNVPIEVGVSYLNEYVNPEENELFIRTTDPAIVPTGVTINVKNSPLSPSKFSNISIKVGSRVLSTTEFSVTDAYRGEIQIPSLNVALQQPVEVTYHHTKTIQSFFSFNGSGKSGQFDFYTSGIDFEIQSLPVQYNGITRIEVIGANGLIVLDPTDYRVEYVANGSQLKLRFLINGPTDATHYAGGKLTTYPTQTDRITVYYQHTLSNSSNQGKIDQKTYGVTLGIKPNDRWSINGEFATAQNNFSFPQVRAIETLVGTGVDNQLYTLTKNSSNPLVENSEVVKLFKGGSGVGLALNQAANYFIDYDQGTIRFKDFTLKPSDNVTVEYAYFDRSKAQGGGINSSNALRLNTSYQLTNALSISGEMMTIDKDYNTIAQIQETKGTNLVKSSIKYTRDTNKSAYINYETRSVFTGNSTDITQAGKSVYRNHDQVSSGLKWSYLNGGFITDHAYSLSVQSQEDLANASQHAIDARTWSYTTGATVGPPRFRTRSSYKISSTENDYKDRLALNESYTHSFDIGSTIYPGQHFGIKQFVITPFYSDSMTETTTTANRSFRHVQIYKLGSRIKPRDSLLASFDAEGKVVSILPTTAKQSSQTPYRELIPNASTQLDYDPNYWFGSNIHIQYNGQESATLGERGQREFRQHYRIKQLSLYPAIQSLNSPFLSKTLSFTNGSRFTYGKLLTDVSGQNNRTDSNGDTDTYTLTQFTPVPSLTVSNLFYNRSDSNSLSAIKSGTTLSQRSNSDSMNVNGALTYKPTHPFVSNMAYSYQFNTSDSRTSSSQYLLPSPTANVATSVNVSSTQSPAHSDTHKLNYSPGTVQVLGVELANVSASGTWFKETKDTTSISDQLSVSSPSTTKRLSESIDDNTVTKETYQLLMVPFNRYKTESDYTHESAFRRRNIDSGNTGTVQSNDYNRGFSLSFNPLKAMTITSKIGHQSVRQYTSPSLNISRQFLQSGFDTYLSQDKYSGSLAANWSVVSWLSLTSSALYLHSNQQSIKPNQTVASDRSISDQFNQFKQTIGFIWKPIKQLSVDFSAGFKQFSQHQQKLGVSAIDTRAEGYDSVIKLSYAPYTSTNRKVNISLKRVDNWGKGFNTLDQSTLKGGSNEFAAISIVDRSDTVWTGSVSIDINIPVSHIRYVETFTIIGRGYLSIVDDRTATGDQNSYDVSGITLTGRLEF